MLTILKFSVTFDTVDHGILLHRLETSYGLKGCVLKWFSSYVDRRTQFIRCGAFESVPTLVMCGVPYVVPQGSVLGPILFLLYTADLVLLIQRHDLCPPAYLSVDLQSIKDIPSRHRLRSWSSDTLAVPTSNLSTVGDRAFSIVAAGVWNTFFAGRSFIQLFVNFQASALGRALLTKLP